MGLFDFLFDNAITKRVNQQIASQQATGFTNALTQLTSSLNTSIPTINPDTADYYQTFKTIGAVYEVTDLITKKVLKSPIITYKVKNPKKLRQAKELFKTDPVQAHILKMTAIEEVDVPELQKLLTNGMCNPYQTGSQFMWSLVLSYLIKGNTYGYANRAGKKAKELYCFPNMTINADQSDFLDPIRGYTLLTNERQQFAPDEIQHIKTGTPAPIDNRMEYLYGVSALRAYLEPLRSIAEGKKQGSKQAKSGGAFGFVAPANKEDQLTKDQKQALHDKMVEARKSNDELSRIFPSSIALSWQQVGLSIGDLQLLELVSASEEDVYRAYHVPLQYHNQKASTSNNQQTAVVQMIYDAVAPVCDVISEALTVWLGEGFGGVTIELDYTQLAEMAVNMKQVADYLKSLPVGVLTYNEMRVVLKYGEKDEDYMNAHYVTNTLVNLQSVFDGTVTPAADATPPA